MFLRVAFIDSKKSRCHKHFTTVSRFSPLVPLTLSRDQRRRVEEMDALSCCQMTTAAAIENVQGSASMQLAQNAADGVLFYSRALSNIERGT